MVYPPVVGDDGCEVTQGEEAAEVVVDEGLKDIGEDFVEDYDWGRAIEAC